MEARPRLARPEGPPEFPRLIEEETLDKPFVAPGPAPNQTEFIINM